MNLFKRLIHLLLRRRNLILCRVPVELSRGDPTFLHAARDLSADFFRASTLYTIAKDIQGQGLQGDVVELGVYKGEFASLINRCFPDRTLYLLDTFSGFNRDEFEKDRLEGLTQRWQPFTTNVSEVLGRMPYPNRVVIKQGQFPKTASGVEGPFVLVCLDVDLYTPTIAGLEYFSARLVDGGYLLVHDFNQPEYRGSRKAVMEFCAKNDAITYVPIGDWGGTAILKRHAGKYRSHA
jgi:O-methyltransferase